MLYAIAMGQIISGEKKEEMADSDLPGNGH